MKVLLLSAYAAQSHVYWQRSLQLMFPDWEWQLLSLPPRYFSWRVRGNPLHWALTERPVLEQPYDLLIATSMVDLATLRGLVPTLGTVPSVLYFHENQFVYPQDRQQHSLLEAQMVSLYSALAADRIVFNSSFNQRTFLEGCDSLLQGMPDKVPPGIVEQLQSKATVLPVPLVEQGNGAGRGWPGSPGQYPNRPLRLLWAGRFEHDKGGENLMAILQQLEETELEYELAVIGQQFRNSPSVFQEIEAEFKHRLVQFGYLDAPEDYSQYLQDSDIILSTALHEFQGLAVLEAVAAGCLPVVPNRLVYPDIFPEAFCYESNLKNPDSETMSAVKLLETMAEQIVSRSSVAPDVTQFQLRKLKQAYEELLLSLAQ